MKASRNRIRLQKRRPRIRMMSKPAPVAWIRGRFVDIPLTQELLEDAGVQSAEEWNEGPTYLEVEAMKRAEELLEPRGILSRHQLLRIGISSWIRERYRILGWIFRLLR